MARNALDDCRHGQSWKRVCCQQVNSTRTVLAVAETGARARCPLQYPIELPDTSLCDTNSTALSNGHDPPREMSRLQRMLFDLDVNGDNRELLAFAAHIAEIPCPGYEALQDAITTHANRAGAAAQAGTDERPFADVKQLANDILDLVKAACKAKEETLYKDILSDSRSGCDLLRECIEVAILDSDGVDLLRRLGDCWNGYVTECFDPDTEQSLRSKLSAIVSVARTETVIELSASGERVAESPPNYEAIALGSDTTRSVSVGWPSPETDAGAITEPTIESRPNSAAARFAQSVAILLVLVVSWIVIVIRERPTLS